jgi:hypothetical protein
MSRYASSSNSERAIGAKGLVCPVVIRAGQSPAHASTARPTAMCRRWIMIIAAGENTRP